jgi:glycosyltransferase involved in cell wall biosynthesis
MSKRVLLIGYQFPPVGGAGVQRLTKFVKYLPEFGWTPSVLTVANPSVPVYDQSLGTDIPPDTLVRRAPTWEPGYALKAAVSAGGERPQQGPGIARRLVKGVARSLTNLVLQPDPQILWRPGAVREGKRLLREVPHEAIMATGPPFSTFLVGAALSRRSGLPLVLDYRDEWDLSGYMENKRPGPLSRFLQSRMQRRVVRTARALVATTRHSARALERVRDSAASTARVTWIYNGFDPDDFPAEEPARRKKADFYQLAYVGTLWNLTSVEPLVEAVRRLAQRSPALAARLELVFAGRRTNPQEEVLGRLRGLPCRIVTHPYLDHDAAIDLVRTADGLCVLLSDVAGAERVVPAKLFESMAARRPIWVIAPPGEVWDLLHDHPAAHRLAPSDVAGIAAALEQALVEHRAGQSLAFPEWDGSRYSRRSQAGELAALLDVLLNP